LIWSLLCTGMSISTLSYFILKITLQGGCCYSDVIWVNQRASFTF
jgi:hypothetical protein